MNIYEIGIKRYGGGRISFFPVSHIVCLYVRDMIL